MREVRCRCRVDALHYLKLENEFSTQAGELQVMSTETAGQSKEHGMHNWSQQAAVSRKDDQRNSIVGSLRRRPLRKRQNLHFKAGFTKDFLFS